MSTGAIIWFRPTEGDANEHGTWVYSHGGGEPRLMLQHLFEAHDRARAPRPSKVRPGSSLDDSWKIGRPGYAASMLCGVDPPHFQVDTYWLTSGGKFHGDIEWLYLVTAEVAGGMPTWLVEVRMPKPSFRDEPTLANTKVRHRKQTIGRLVERLGLESPQQEIVPATSSRLGTTGEDEAGHLCVASVGA